VLLEPLPSGCLLAGNTEGCKKPLILMLFNHHQL
jgi:hypothetical protein